MQTNFSAVSNKVVHNPGHCNVMFDVCPRCGQKTYCPSHQKCMTCNKMTVTEVTKQFPNSPKINFIVAKAIKNTRHNFANRRYRQNKKAREQKLNA